MIIFNDGKSISPILLNLYVPVGVTVHNIQQDTTIDAQLAFADEPEGRYDAYYVNFDRMPFKHYANPVTFALEETPTLVVATMAAIRIRWSLVCADGMFPSEDGPGNLTITPY